MNDAYSVHLMLQKKMKKKNLFLKKNLVSSNQMFLQSNGDAKFLAHEYWISSIC